MVLITLEEVLAGVVPFRRHLTGFASLATLATGHIPRGVCWEPLIVAANSVVLLHSSEASLKPFKALSLCRQQVEARAAMEVAWTILPALPTAATAAMGRLLSSTDMGYTWEKL